ncbi:branched chain amino acid ABC transporter ATPase [Klebsiella pneumoniae subsp. ozaenae]|uniref:Branched chain amino acid ABC transporter ATPase n=1 Tax=Klebsiella pneumoniae subsp. ozaenae TaxID=574 RepID=A0A377YX08_KLEPO|nr:branched chain amino acid ABC transporter ATPase [Klebsiella pneumoniae subsp. ozaenae]
MENAMLTFDNVSAHYGKIQALHNVSLHIKQGEIVTLIGANGAGKPPCSARCAATRAPPAGALSLTVRILPTGKPRRSCARRWRSFRKGGASFRV